MNPLRTLCEGVKISIPFEHGIEVLCYKEAMYRSKTAWNCKCWYGYNGWFVLRNNDYENALHFDRLQPAIRKAEELEH